MQRVDAAARRLTHPAARLERQARDAMALGNRLRRAFHHLLFARTQHAAMLRQRLALRLRQPLPQAHRLAAARGAWQRGLHGQQQRTVARVQSLERSLAHLNPNAVLERGYAIVTAAGGEIVCDSARLTAGDDVTLKFNQGHAGATIRTIDS